MRLKIRNAKWWLDHVEAWQKSGITQTEYCRSNKLNLKSFSNWKLKHIKDSRRSSDPEIPVFTSSYTDIPLIPVAISEQIDSATTEAEFETPKLSSFCFSGVTLIVKNDYQISLAVDFNPRTLKNVLAVLVE